MDELSEEDKLTVYRARKIQRFLSQPFRVAEVFTNMQGKFVDLKDTIEAFKGILAGNYDHLEEAAFFMVGKIEEVELKAKQLAAKTQESSGKTDAQGHTRVSRKGMPIKDAVDQDLKKNAADLEAKELELAKKKGGSATYLESIKARWVKWHQNYDTNVTNFEQKATRRSAEKAERAKVAKAAADAAIVADKAADKAAAKH